MIANAEQLRSVVGTMKAMASVNIRQYQRAVEALADYNMTVELGLQAALKKRRGELKPTEPGVTGRIGVVVFGSDQGLVGQYNQEIAAYALNEMEASGATVSNRSVMAVGLRVGERLRQAEQPVEEILPVPGSISGITPSVESVLVRIERWRFENDIRRIILCFHLPGSGASYSPYTLRILPLDREWLRIVATRDWPTRAIPMFVTGRQELMADLIKNYIFVSLFRAQVGSLASENASRLSAMEAAEDRIDHRLDDLRNQYHQLRQRSITEELFDIVAGFEASSGSTVS
jgi:F-type H+-transporting ATPase subunit gamma